MPSLQNPGSADRSHDADEAPRRAVGSRRGGARRAYRRPAIVLRERIETMAADCAIPGGKNDASCILGFS